MMDGISLRKRHDNTLRRMSPRIIGKPGRILTLTILLPS